MITLMKKIALAVVVVVLAVLAYAATKPDTLHVQRSTSIQAAPESLQPLIADFHKWIAWSPYEKKDPALRRTYSGAENGKGAVYEWNGNHEIGQGRMEILDSSASKVTIKLDFIKPFEGHNTAEFRLEPKGSLTDVTWVMHGPNSYLGKLIGVFIDMDRMIGADFEAGLANMKSIAESKRQES